jgi:DNA repair exonuclease SbcCD ATPase subunit
MPTESDALAAFLADPEKVKDFLFWARHIPRDQAVWTEQRHMADRFLAILDAREAEPPQRALEWEQAREIEALQVKLADREAQLAEYKAALDRSREGWRERITFAMEGPHTRENDCPTWYDGCNCGIVQRLQAQLAEKDAALRIATAQLAGDQCMHVQRADDLQSRLTQAEATLAERARQMSGYVVTLTQRLEKAKAHHYKAALSVVIGELRALIGAVEAPPTEERDNG